MTRRLWLSSTALACFGLYGFPVEAQSRLPIVVHDAPGLQDALTPANAGRTVHLERGEYLITAPLVVPDGATLEGEGIMLGRGLPDGFAAGSETHILPVTSFSGDLITLGHGAAIKDIIVEDVFGRTGNDNVIAIHSRTPGDRVSASITRCEIINPKRPGAGPDGPLGRALAVLTSNPRLANAPPPDEDANVSVVVSHSIIRATGGSSAIFAINFASRGEITIVATSNRIFGSMELTGGVSRPDEVRDARLTVRSEHNVYAPDVDAPAGTTPVAWTIDGGSGAPVPNFAAPGTSGNEVRFTSLSDVIDGFPAGVVATAGKRHNLTSGPSSSNLVAVQLIGLQLRTRAEGSDLMFHAAAADGPYPPGDGNLLRVLMAGVSGSGERRNDYANEVGAGLPQDLGTGNQLEVVGSPASFRVLNPGILPPPTSDFFVGFRP